MYKTFRWQVGNYPALCFPINTIKRTAEHIPTPPPPIPFSKPLCTTSSIHQQLSTSECWPSFYCGPVSPCHPPPELRLLTIFSLEPTKNKISSSIGSPPVHYILCYENIVLIRLSNVTLHLVGHSKVSRPEFGISSYGHIYLQLNAQNL